MNSIHYCIVDENGNYVDLVSMHDPDGKNLNEPYKRPIKKGEKLIDEQPPTGILKPRWKNGTWVETASQEDLSIWIESQQVPQLEQITLDDIIENQIDLDFRLTMMELGI